MSEVLPPNDKDKGEQIKTPYELIEYIWDKALEDPGRKSIEEERQSGLTSMEKDLLALVPSHSSAWKKFSLDFISDPTSVELHDPEIIESKDIQFVEHATGSPDNPIENLPLKYSIMEASIDKTEFQRLPHDFEKAPPQVYVNVREIFSDSERDVQNILRGLLEEYINPLRSNRYGERIKKKRDTLRNEILKISSILLTDLTLIGKVVYYNPNVRNREPLNILGFRLLFTAGGNLIVYKLLKWHGKNTQSKMNLDLPSYDIVKNKIHPELEIPMRKFSQEIRKRAGKL